LKEAKGKLLKNNELAGRFSTRAGKSINPPTAFPDDPCEDLLDGLLPAGWSASVDGGKGRFSDKFFKIIKTLFSTILSVA
jgi:hypothetical protein